MKKNGRTLEKRRGSTKREGSLGDDLNIERGK
jgi:hypothetical protein